MTIEEAAAIVRQKWGDNDGCRSCGWHGALYEYEPLERMIDGHDIAEGVVNLICMSGEEDSHTHRGMRFYLTTP